MTRLTTHLLMRYSCCSIFPLIVLLVYLKDDINCTVSFFGAGVLDEDMHLQIGDGCKEAVINPENEKLPFGGKHIIIIGELLQQASCQLISRT